MSPLLRTLGLNIRRHRKAKGLSQQALGAAAEVDFKFLGSVERGGSNVSIEVIERIALALDVPPHDLLRSPSGSSATSYANELDALLARLDRSGIRLVQEVASSYLTHARGERPGSKGGPKGKTPPRT